MGMTWDIRPGDRLLQFTTTAWMMWNALVSSLLMRASIVLLDGDPAWPDLMNQWRVAEQTQPTHMGLAPAFLMACRKAGLQPGRDLDLSGVRVVATAGSPLPGEGYDYVYEQLGPDVLLVNGSGGTDVCSAIVSGGPMLPVYRGEIAGRALAMDTAAFDLNGQEVVGELGELVIRRPSPSMPVRFWGDEDGSRYRAAYFDMYPGVWRQGDWVRFTEQGTCVLTGRSDATLNRGGVRMGTSELYTVVEEIPEVKDSLVVHLEDPEGGTGELILFVVADLDDELRGRIAGRLRADLSPRHVPDRIEAVPAIPRTLTGKKLEAPVKRILRGEPADAVASRGALAQPEAIDAFVAFALNRSSSIAGRRPTGG
jgi:acetoacetyl-CoA synthetase